MHDQDTGGYPVQRGNVSEGSYLYTSVREATTPGVLEPKHRDDYIKLLRVQQPELLPSPLATATIN